MFKILKIEEYNEIVNTINDQSEKIKTLEDLNRNLKKDVDDIQNELHPKYFNS